MMRRLAMSVLALLLLTAGTVFAAQEPFATYPPLPVGFSSIKVFDREGRYAGRILPEQRYWVSIDRIPLFLQKAVVAVEDSRFYEHGGIDVRGIARAVVKDVIKRRLAEGGSTITQQLIKNKYLSGEKSIDRKLKEGMMAIEFEKKYSKKQILEMYFNEIYYGNGAWGIGQAARLYFDKNPEELNDAECSLLAGVQKNPGRYNPLGKPADVVKRRDVVLTRMEDLGMITPRKKKELRSNPAPVAQSAQAPHYLAYLRSRLVERFGFAVIEQGGLEVTAAMDLNLQKLAEKTLAEGVKRISPALQGALVCLDPQSGDMLAAVGGVDFPKSAFNRAFNARRQPGSAIKPLLYASALEQGITAASIWSDKQAAYPKGNGESWTPHNYDGKDHGSLTLRQALAHSSNVVAVKLLETVGVNDFTALAARDGLQFTGRDLSLALGTEDVTLNDLVAAYAPFANGGIRPEPRTIIRIYDRTRRSWTESPTGAALVMSPATAYVTTRMLGDVLNYGTAKNLRKFSQQYPMAGKTGTTSDYRDAWFIGYTPQMVTGVWLGHDKPKPGGKGFTGGGVAAPIWERFMRGALAGRQPVDFVRPESVVSVAIDPTSGKLASAGCPERREELFISGTEPAEVCPLHSLPVEVKTPLLPVVPVFPATKNP